MKNVQIIDEAVDCDYPIHGCSDTDFLTIFPAPNQDLEFSEDLSGRIGLDRFRELMERLDAARLDKKRVSGIHGTLFVGLSFKKRCYTEKRHATLIEYYVPDDDGDEGEEQ